MDVGTFIIAFLALIGVIIILVFFFAERSKFLGQGAFNVQQGTSTGTTDTITVPANTFYIANISGSTTYTVNLLANDANTAGYEVVISNPKSNGSTLTVVPASGIQYTDGTGEGATIDSGETAQFIFTDLNKLYRYY